MTEPSSEPPKSRRQHVRGKSLDVSALNLTMINEDGDLQPSDAGKRAQMHGRAKSMDLRGLEMEEVRDALFEDGSAKLLYKNSVREKAIRKGRIFQPPAPAEGTPKPEETPAVAMDPREAAFTEETKAMEKEREQLDVDIYGLEQDIRMITRALEQKEKALKEAKAALFAHDPDRQRQWWDAPSDVRPRAQRFPSDNSSTSGSPPLQPSVFPAGSVSPVLLGSVSPGVFPAESPSSTPSSPNVSVSSSSSFSSATASPSPTPPLLSASPSPVVPTLPPPVTSMRHSSSNSNLRIPSGNTPPQQANPSVLFVVPAIGAFPNSRATANVSSVAPPSPRRLPFSRNLNKDR